MNAYIDDFRLLRIESDIYIHDIRLKDNHVTWQRNEGINQFFHTEKEIKLNHDDQIEINGQFYPLNIGMITLTDTFEKRYRYDGPLGAVYHKSHTEFYLFSPVAKEVFLVIDQHKYPMTYIEPIWTVKIQKDLHLKTYRYEIRLVDSFKSVIDPYANALSSKGAHIIDFNQTLKLEDSPIKVKNYVDTVIYEGHIRDLSIGLDVEHKGLFEGLLDHSEVLGSNVLKYIKKLGMTHLQLLPVFDFEGVDDEHKNLLYNWGYNPSLYFAIEGWYSKDPSNPLDRINGLKKIVEYAHDIKLGVNMDVVYNHVYNHETFPYDDIVPGYFYRHDKYNKMTNSSYCGNDVETRNYMVRRLIVDSLVHFAKTYKIDGFRFDLMGLLDIETMLEIQAKLREYNPNIMLYGEGWNIPTEVKQKQRPNLHNQALFPMFAHFNDYYRNTMKGELYGDRLGYTMGNQHLTQKAMHAIVGSPHMFTSPNQSINYVECHDNLTFYDKMIITSDFSLPDFKVTQDFANHLIAISQGIPFYHAGQEFFRTKKGVENSYNASDDINEIKWRIREDTVNKLKTILKIRKKFSLYRQSNYNELTSIEKDKKLIIYRLEDDKNILLHYIKNYYDLEKLPLLAGKLIFSSQKVIINDKYFYVDQPGVYIIHIKK